MFHALFEPREISCKRSLKNKNKSLKNSNNSKTTFYCYNSQSRPFTLLPECNGAWRPGEQPDLAAPIPLNSHPWGPTAEAMARGIQ